MAEEPITRRSALEKLALGIAVPNLKPLVLPGDDNRKGDKVRPEDLRSGTLFGQYQLRGSILVIKDNQNAVSGYIAFGTNMTTVPTSSSSGTGVYIDYSGIYGLNGGAKQFYLQASDGKGIAGGGVVTLDSSGITLTIGSNVENYVKWKSGSNTVAWLFGDQDGGGNYNLQIWAEGTNATPQAYLSLNASTKSGGSLLNFTFDATIATPVFRINGGHLTWTTNNTYDIGATGAKPRDLLLGRDIYTNSGTMTRTTTNYTNGAAANVGTLNNAPAAGNPTKWIPVDDNGTTRYIPAW